MACKRGAGEINTYAPGNCTWWCYQRTAWVPSNWGNAADWLNAATACGFSTSQTPKVGAIAIWGPGVDPPFGFGHCGLVTAVRPDGGFTVDEMNWKGLGAIDQRNVSDTSNLNGFILPPNSASTVAANPASQASSGPDPFGVRAATTQLISSGQVAGGAILIGLGLVLVVAIVAGPTVMSTARSLPLPIAR